MAVACPEVWHSSLLEKAGAAEFLYRIDPLKDPRWSEFLKGNARASVFHSAAWLEALRRTYGYESIAFTTSPPCKPLDNGLVFCYVDSWLTGRRLVSLPFSDHCEPLVKWEDVQSFLQAFRQECLQKRLRYIEIRPIEPIEIAIPACRTTLTYSFHQLDLSPSLDAIFHGFHKDSIKRKIRRAEREGLDCYEGSTEPFLNTFHKLLRLTRRRHCVPPQPKKWFRNLTQCFGEALKIRIAVKDGQPVAGVLTIRYKDALVYKYGASDPRFHSLGAMHLLLWRSIQEAKNSGLRLFDLGRSDLDQSGLITFKNRWGARQSTLTYSRYSDSTISPHIFDPGRADWKIRLAKNLFCRVHPTVLSIIGNLLYKHVG